MNECILHMSAILILLKTCSSAHHLPSVPMLNRGQPIYWAFMVSWICPCDFLVVTPSTCFILWTTHILCRFVPLIFTTGSWLRLFLICSQYILSIRFNLPLALEPATMVPTPQELLLRASDYITRELLEPWFLVQLRSRVGDTKGKPGP